MKKEKSKVVIRFSVIEFLYFAAFATSTFLSVYLREVGLNSIQIGSITSLGAVLGLVFLPVWGTVSDRIHSSRPVFMFCIGTAASLFCILPLMGKMWTGYVLPFFILVPLIFIFKQPATALLDGWIVNEIAPLHINYGSIRMWGSIGFSVISLALSSFIIKARGTAISFYLYSVFAIPVMLLCLNRNTDKAKNTGALTEKEKVPFSFLYKNFYFITYVIFSLGLNIYMSVTIIFMPYILEYAGCSATLIGIISGYRALAEVVSMFLTKLLRKHIPLPGLLSIAGILFAIEHLFYSYASSLIHILILITFSGFAGGIAYSMSPTYIHEIVPEKVHNTAQSFNSITMSLVGIFGTFAGGFIINAYGIEWLTRGSGIFILSLTILFALSIPFGQKVLHINPPKAAVKPI